MLSRYNISILRNVIQNAVGTRCTRLLSSDKSKDIKLPDPPDNCCMSNCANCVWIQYAQELEAMFHDGGETAKKLIMEKLEDPAMKAFLSMELRNAAKSVPDGKGSKK